jgi:hypothetical protein
VEPILVGISNGADAADSRTVIRFFQTLKARNRLSYVDELKVTIFRRKLMTPGGVDYGVEWKDECAMGCEYC